MKPTVIQRIEAKVAAIPGREDRLAQQVGMLEAELAKTLQTLADYTGASYKASSGCGLLTVFLGEAEVLIEYEYDPGEASQTSGPPERCYEGVAANAVIVGALINGVMVDPCDAGISDSVIERWVQTVIDTESEAAANAREDDRRDFYIDSQRDFA